MKSLKQNLPWKASWISLLIVGGLVFFWLLPLKAIARLAARFGNLWVYTANFRKV